ncbi:MAG: type III-B CRISPR module RAMP protein Cmr4 [Moorellaceae bacterium]
MFEKSGILFLYVETPLHAGSGTSLGVVDLPIQRERTTGYPMVQASGLKGCLREAAGGQDAPKIKLVFGPDPQRGERPDEHAGALSVGEARILLFPVRSLMGVFGWVTSRDVLARFQRDAEMAELAVGWKAEGPQDQGEAWVSNSCDLIVPQSDKIVLEEFAFKARKKREVDEIAAWLAENAFPKAKDNDEYTYWRNKVKTGLVILPENAFRDFTLFSTEVISRIRLNDEKKTVERGALWSEEHLPSDTLLYAALFASKPRVSNAPNDLKDGAAVLNFVKKCVDGKRLQLGGDSTVGRGFVKVRMATGGALS